MGPGTHVCTHTITHVCPCTPWVGGRELFLETETLSFLSFLKVQWNGSVWVVEGSCRREHPKAFCGLGGVPRPCPRGLRSGLVGGDLLLEVLLCVQLCTGLASVSHGTRSSPRGKRHQGHGFYR